MQFHEHLKKLRLELGHTQEQMADLLSMERSTYCRLEHNPNPALHYVERISTMFKVDAFGWLNSESRSAEVPDEVQGSKIIHMTPNDQSDHERQWRSRAVDILGQITNTLTDLLKNSRGGGGHM